MPAPAAALAAAAAKAVAKRIALELAWEAIRKLPYLLLLLAGLTLFILTLTLSPALLWQAVQAQEGSWTNPPGAGIPDEYWQMYSAAAREYKVNPYLLGSIHKKETNLSTSTLPGVRSGWNGCGAAGPMQFGIVGVPPYNGTVPNCPGNPAGASGTWATYADAVKPIDASRPASYRLDYRQLPACRDVRPTVGCVYDDFDAIAAAAKYLKAGGADTSLTSEGTRDAVFSYNHSFVYVDNVLAQARIWEAKAMAAGADVGAGGARAIVEHAVSIAMRFGSASGSREGLSTVYVCSDHRPGDTTKNGLSDHSSNNATRAARDIAYRGRNCLSGPPSPVLDQAAVAIGTYFGRSYQLGAPIAADTFTWKGYRVQIIWRTGLAQGWGDHRGHIHVGARKP